MRRGIPSLIVALSAGWSTSMSAQADWVKEVLAAAQLPVATAEARREGIGSAEIKAAIEAMTKARVPAHEAVAVIDTARAARREHGPAGNFGAFVQSQLAAGKRGRDLAAAIRAEHARMGKGSAARGGPPGQSRGKSDTARDAQSRGRSDTARGRGRNDPRPTGRPEAAGRKQDDRGRGRGAPVRPNR